MLCGGDTNSTGGGNVVFPSSLGLRQSIQHCTTGEGGSQMLFLQRKKEGVENSYHCMGVPRTFGRHSTYAKVKCIGEILSKLLFILGYQWTVIWGVRAAAP